MPRGNPNWRKGETPPGAKPFVKGQSGNPKGKPRNLVRIINDTLQGEGFERVKSQQVLECYQVLLNLPISHIQKIASPNNDDYPIIYKLVAKELLGKNGAIMLEKLLDRAFGKATENLKVKAEVENKEFDASTLTDEQLRKLAEIQRSLGAST